MAKNLNSNATVSIIIPVFNREKIISQTLDSIRNQIYQNWECIVIDDSSTDGTLQVLKEYSKIESRICYYKRPQTYMKGANSCRNYGFSKSQGAYIIWFDSDDLMTSDHIERKILFIQENESDFIVARTQNFQDGQLLQPYFYEKKAYGITASDFILLKIHWYTYDVILRREIGEKISWNESMRSWQDYNYFCKMLLVTEKGFYLDKILTHRRIHSESIQRFLNRDSKTFYVELLENRFFTYNDISKAIESNTRNELVFGMMNLCFELSKLKVKSGYVEKVEQIVRDQLGITSKNYFKLALIIAGLIKKGHYFLNKAKKK